MKNVIAKIVNSDGVRYEKCSLNSEPTVIGRSWQTDLVLEDRFVNPEHLKISLNEAGLPEVQDLNSVNGTMLKRRKLGSTPISYSWGQALRLGDTKLSFIDAESEVGPTLLRSGWVSFLSKLNRPITWFISLLLLTLVLVGEEALNSREAFDLYKALYKVWPEILTALGLTVFFGMLSRLLKGENNFGPLWILTSWTIIVASITIFLIKIVRFNLQDLDAGVLLSNINGNLILVVFLFALLSVVSNLSYKARLSYSLAAGLTVLAFIYSADLFKEEQQKWSAAAKTDQSTLPSYFLLRKKLSPDDYILHTDKLFIDIDKQISNKKTKLER